MPEELRPIQEPRITVSTETITLPQEVIEHLNKYTLFSIPTDIDYMFNRNSISYQAVKKEKKMTQYTYFTCPVCGKKRRSTGMEFINGVQVCKHCKETKYEYCQRCRRYELKERMTTVYDENGEEKRVCRTCLRNNYIKCESCGEYHIYYDIKNVRNEQGTKKICLKCLKERELEENINYIQCDLCGTYIPESSTSSIDDYVICEECEETNLYECQECGEKHLRQNMFYDEEDGEYYCRDCFVSGSILSYHSDLVNFEKLKADENDERIFGFELEVAGDRYQAREFSKYFNGEMVMMNDSSVDGFEIVTMPMDLKFMYETFFPKLEKGLKFLKRNGFRGHNHGGLHIHVSENQIDAKTAGQLKQILYGNQCDRNTWLMLAQRTRNEMNEWANMDSSRPFNEIYYGREKYLSGHRHTALNYDSRTGTYEFRIFNSSLRMDRIIKNIECVLALIEYAKKFKEYKAPACSTGGFIEYVIDNQDKYKVLYDFIIEKNIKVNFGNEDNDVTENDEREAA